MLTKLLIIFNFILFEINKIKYNKFLNSFFIIAMKFIIIILFYFFVGLIDIEVINNFFNTYALSEDNLDNEKKEEGINKKKLYFFIFVSSILFIGLIYLYYKSSSGSDVISTINDNQPNVPGNQPNVPGNQPNVPGNQPNVPGNQPNVPGNQPNVPGNQPNVPGNQLNITPENLEALKLLEQFMNKTLSPEVINEINESIQNNKDNIEDLLKELVEQLNKNK